MGPIIPGMGKARDFDLIWTAHSQVPSEQKAIKILGKGKRG